MMARIRIDNIMFRLKQRFEDIIKTGHYLLKVCICDALTKRFKTINN